MVVVVENIEQRRQPFPNLEAVYILTPSNNSVAGFLEDFTEKGNMYAAAHLFFTDGIILIRLTCLPYKHFMRDYSR